MFMSISICNCRFVSIYTVSINFHASVMLITVILALEAGKKC